MIDKIKKIAESKKISISKLISEIDMTESGFYAMLRNDSMKIKTLQKIADVLGVSVSYFFSELNHAEVHQNETSGNSDKKQDSLVEKTVVIHDTNSIETEFLKREIDNLRELIRMKDKYIEIIEKQFNK